MEKSNYEMACVEYGAWGDVPVKEIFCRYELWVRSRAHGQTRVVVVVVTDLVVVIVVGGRGPTRGLESVVVFVVGVVDHAEIKVNVTNLIEHTLTTLN